MASDARKDTVWMFSDKCDSRALLERLFQWPHAVTQPGPVGYAGFAFLITGSLGAAMLFAMVTEDQTATVRRRLSALLDVVSGDRRIGRRPAAP